MDIKSFVSPPAGYGEVSFFWWQGDPVTREKLGWILDQLQQHHISGLQINYAHGDSGGRTYGLTMPSNPHPLSDEWWDTVKWFQGEAKKRGMAISLSDYTLSSPGQQSYTDELLSEHPEFIGQIIVKVADGAAMNAEYYDVRPLCHLEGATIYAVRVPFSMNPMHPGVGAAVSDKFFGAFERHMPGQCGSGINFFFSDELTFNVRGLLWDDTFAEEFEKRKGYDIRPLLNHLFEHVSAETPRIRMDYYDVVVELSEDGYFRPLYEWHQSRGMTFGCDHGGRGRDVTEFGDYFRTMKWNQGPGNDQPQLASDIIKSKVSSSIAHLYERPRTWLEGYYSSGWQTTSADVTDATFRNFALGHNLLSLHGLYYSTHGSMWEWAPPCNHHHMPYWGEMEKLLGCTERLSWLMTRGKHKCDVAIVYPVAAMEADEVRGKQAVKCAFDTAQYLYSHGVDFDFIDFQSIERADVSGNSLKVAGESYRTVAIPNMQAVRFGMIKALSEFAQNGGHVAIIGDLPAASDRIGENDPALDEFVKLITDICPSVKDAEELLNGMRERYSADIILPNNVTKPYIQHRIIDGEDLYFVYNVPNGAKCGFRAQGVPILLDPWTGKRFAISGARTDGEFTYLNMDARFSGLMLLLFAKSADGCETLYDGKWKDIPFTGQWECELEPTLNNKYGDYRLPAFDGYLSAEAREFEYRSTADAGKCGKSIYSYGTYFYVHRGELDEQIAAAMCEPADSFLPYRFSMKTGVEGDAGYQASYHGLKGKISDDFIALGKKRLTYAGSSSEYEDDSPYYLYTNLLLTKPTRVRFDTGRVAPEIVWLDHRSINVSDIVELTSGLHPLVLKYPHGLRTRFIALNADAPEFVQTAPLTMRWYKNPTVIPFDADPALDGHECEFRFMAPAGLQSISIPESMCSPANSGTECVRILIDGVSLNRSENVFTPEKPLSESVEITMYVTAKDGIHDTALINDPILFTCGRGVMDVQKPISEQGLKFYSGGIRYFGKAQISRADGHVRLLLGDIDCAAQIYVNGKEAGTLVAPPYILDISNYVRSGDNDIEIVVHNSLNNHMLTIPTNYRFEHSSNR